LTPGRSKTTPPDKRGKTSTERRGELENGGAEYRDPLQQRMAIRARTSTTPQPPNKGDLMIVQNEKQKLIPRTGPKREEKDSKGKKPLVSFPWGYVRKCPGTKRTSDSGDSMATDTPGRRGDRRC
jgi:hypothetical protein